MSVIHIDAKPLNTSDSNKIRKWLNDPAYFLFQSHLHAAAAIKAADAANSMIAGSESDLIDARNSAEDARTLKLLSDKLSEMRDESKPFTTVELQPQPPL